MLPGELLGSLFDGPVRVLAQDETPLSSLGAATGEVHRLRLDVDADGGRHEVRLIRKRLSPVTSGRHVAANSDRSHWAYWRREPLAYESGLLPDGPDLWIPRYLGTIDDYLYVEDVVGGAVPAADAALALGRWQRSLRLPGRPWLAGHQLAQRLAVTALDPNADVDESWRAVWADRWRYLDALDRLPYVLSHGDCHLGHFIADDDRIVLVDWATVGASPIGADAAHVALSAGVGVLDEYVRGLRGAVTGRTVAVGYAVTLALTGISRAHWHAETGTAFPAAGLVTAAARNLMDLLPR